jgi:hypothetical protein
LIVFWNERGGNERYIELGRVQCPRAGCDVDLDACYGCRFMQEVSERAIPFVRCNPPAKSVPTPC